MKQVFTKPLPVKILIHVYMYKSESKTKHQKKDNSIKVLLFCMHLSNPHPNQKSFPASVCKEISESIALHYMIKTHSIIADKTYLKHHLH